MYIDKMTKKQKIEELKSEISSCSEKYLDELLRDFGFEYSYEDDEENYDND